MKRGKGPTEPQTKIFESKAEIDKAISKLKRRIDEVKKLDPNEIAHNDQRVKTAEANVRDAILEIYGPDVDGYQYPLNTGGIRREKPSCNTWGLRFF